MSSIQSQEPRTYDLHVIALLTKLPRQCFNFKGGTVDSQIKIKVRNGNTFT